jgi:hypothetical protein
MEWTSPQCSEIKMDAEIGSYQEDFDGERDPLFVRAFVRAFVRVPVQAAETAADAAA